MILIQKIRVNEPLAIAQALSVIAVGALLSGWTSWVVLPSLPAILIGDRDLQLGLFVGAMLEMIALHRHGVLAFVALLGVVLSWSNRAAVRGCAGLLMLLAGWLGRARAMTSWAMWITGGLMLLCVLMEVTRWNE
jgi:hypothetical protein